MKVFMAIIVAVYLQNKLKQKQEEEADEPGAVYGGIKNAGY